MVKVGTFGEYWGDDAGRGEFVGVARPPVGLGAAVRVGGAGTGEWWAAGSECDAAAVVAHIAARHHPRSFVYRVAQSNIRGRYDARFGRVLFVVAGSTGAAVRQLRAIVGTSYRDACDCCGPRWSTVERADDYYDDGPDCD